MNLHKAEASIPRPRQKLTNCTLSDNEGNNAGGGIYVGGGTTTLNNCTVTRNTANAEEGWGDGAYVYGTLILNNTEIIDNQADNTGYGGARVCEWRRTVDH